MKKIVNFIIVLLLVLSVPFFALANEKNDESKTANDQTGNSEINITDYNAYLKNYDLSCFDKLDNTTYDVLESLGLTDFNYNNLINFSFSDFVSAVFGVLKGSIETPIQSCLIIFVFIIFSSLFQSFRTTLNNDEMSSLFSTVSALVIAVILALKMKNTISLACATISICADFIYAFIPVFCVIVATSGNTVAAFSTNTLLLSLAQALNYISKNIFIPLTNCFLAIGICSGIRSELNLHSIVQVMKKYITSIISVCAASFVSILSIKTAVASRADAIGLRSIRFAINSIVPVIGSAISEGLLSIQTYSSLIRSSVGIVGIIAVLFVFLPAIIDVALWRFSLSITGVVSDAFGDSSVTLVLKSFCDAMLIMNVILILSMVTTIISIGILVAAKGSV